MPKQFWLNIGKPLKHATLHEATCSHVIHRRKARYKGVGKMERDGGWFARSTIEQAKAKAKKECESYEFIECSFCQPEHELEKSPFEVQSIELPITTEEILDAIRSGHERNYRG